jgi:hypothetical protein
MGETDKARATLTFFGEPRPIPKPGERVMLRVADGSWREGFLCVSDPLTEDEERRVWVASEEEYRRAQREGREPAGDTWPTAQMVVADD